MSAIRRTLNRLDKLTANPPGRVVVRLSLIMLLLGFTWRVVRYGLAFPLWGDEAFIVANLHSRGFADMFSPLEHSQIAPLGFMWAELISSRLWGFSVLALRLPAFLCGLFSMVLFWHFARRILDKRSALLAIAIFAASFYVMRHGAEVKPYAGDLAISLALLYLGWMVYRQSQSTLRWLSLIAMATVGVWLSYPAVFIAAATAMLLAELLWRERCRRLFVWLGVYVLVLGISFLCMYFFFAKAHSPSTAKMLAAPTWKNSFPPPMAQFWRLPWWLLEIHTGNMLAYPVGSKNFGSILTTVLVVLGSIGIWRRGQRPLLILLLGALPLMLITAAMHKYPYGTSARVSQHMAPAFCLLAGVGLSAALRFWLARKRPIKGICIATLVMAGIIVGGMVRDTVYKPCKKFSDRRNLDAMETLADLTNSQDQWVIFNALEDVTHAPDIHTYGGSAARFRHYVRQFGPENLSWSPPAKQISAVPGGHTWLIIYRDNKKAFREDLLEPYLQIVRRRLGRPKRRWFELTAPKDPKRSQTEGIEVYQFEPPDA